MILCVDKGVDKGVVVKVLMMCVDEGGVVVLVAVRVGNRASNRSK